MTPDFDDDVIAAVLDHMNGDHAADNLLIARAFDRAFDRTEDAEHAASQITGAVMIGLDGDGGTWRVFRGAVDAEVRIAWPGGPISDRPAIRREVVALHALACERLGVSPRAHEQTTRTTRGFRSS